MKQIILFLFIASATLACKKDDPETQLTKVAGSWEPVAREEFIDDKYIWKDIQPASHNILMFRPDGVVTYTSGFSVCCAPNSLSINGNMIKIVPQSEVSNALCAMIRCGSCQTWGIETHGDEIIVSYCGVSRTKYVRKN